MCGGKEKPQYSGCTCGNQSHHSRGRGHAIDVLHGPCCLCVLPSRGKSAAAAAAPWLCTSQLYSASISSLAKSKLSAACGHAHGVVRCDVGCTQHAQHELKPQGPAGPAQDIQRVHSVAGCHQALHSPLATATAKATAAAAANCFCSCRSSGCCSGSLQETQGNIQPAHGNAHKTQAAGPAMQPTAYHSVHVI